MIHTVCKLKQACKVKQRLSASLWTDVWSRAGLWSLFMSLPQDCRLWVARDSYQGPEINDWSFLVLGPTRVSHEMEEVDLQDVGCFLSVLLEQNTIIIHLSVRREQLCRRSQHLWDLVVFTNDLNSVALFQLSIFMFPPYWFNISEIIHQGTYQNRHAHHEVKRKIDRTTSCIIKEMRKILWLALNNMYSEFLFKQLTIPVLILLTMHGWKRFRELLPLGTLIGLSLM